MNVREKLSNTLNFVWSAQGGAVNETFYPWDETIDRWIKEEGVPKDFASEHIYDVPKDPVNFAVNDTLTKAAYGFEDYMGFEGIKRVMFRLPIIFEEIVLEETDEYILKRDRDGWHRKYFKDDRISKDIKPPVTSAADWQNIKKMVNDNLSFVTDADIKRILRDVAQGHEEGQFSTRLRISGFFWTPRELLGIEEHMIGFYTDPKLIHDICQFVLSVYMRFLGKVCEIIQPDVVLIEEDLSGKNGPMLSPQTFDEFIKVYYEELFPFLKKHGASNIFIDTDGDFNTLIPNFIESGIDGFLPMDVNAGMDIVAVKKAHPKLKFIGGYNKLCLLDGKKGIDNEFERILPVVKSGGYIVGLDHQAPPQVTLDDYKYYITKLRAVMKQACSNLG